MTRPAILCFGAFELNARTGELRKGGALVKLQPQPLRVLALLAGRSGELVTREELQQQIWGNDTFVDFEQGLNYCIKQIRLALGDDSETPRYVETLPRRGYRFLAPVTRADSASAPASSKTSANRERRSTSIRSAGVALGALALVLLVAGGVWWQHRSLPPAAPTGRVMLAVLPFENLSGDPEQDYFSEGLTDEAISQLGRLHPEGLGVIARTSAMHYKDTRETVAEIGQELGVDYILEGSVRREGNRVRITVNLVQVKNQTPIWTESYQRDLQDILALQASVASAIARAIRLNLTTQQQARLQSPRPVNPEAYEAYLKGVYFFGKRSDEGFHLAIENYQRAIALDPNYAPAYAGLALAYTSSAFWGMEPPAAVADRIRQAATKAVELDDTLPAAHNAMAFVYAMQGDVVAAERESKRSIELSPTYEFGLRQHAARLRQAGRIDEALAVMERARQADPLSLIVNNGIAWDLYLARRYDAAITQYQRTLQLDPNFVLAYFDLGRAYEAKGMLEKALAEFEKARELSPTTPYTLGGLGHCYALMGKKDKANETLAELRSLARRRYVSPLDTAFIYIGLGEKDRALEWLGKAAAQHTPWLVYLRSDPIYDPLRSDPRFQEIVRKIGLPAVPPQK